MDGGVAELTLDAAGIAVHPDAVFGRIDGSLLGTRQERAAQPTCHPEVREPTYQSSHDTHLSPSFMIVQSSCVRDPDLRPFDPQILPSPRRSPPVHPMQAAACPVLVVGEVRTPLFRVTLDAGAG